MKSVRYIDLAIEAGQHKNDFALSRKLGWSSGAISQYRSGKRVMDNEACIAIAMEANTDPLKVIMAADIDRAERAGQHSLWEVFMQRTSIAASVLAVAGVTFFLTPSSSEAAPVKAPTQEHARPICIMSNSRRAWRSFGRTVSAWAKRLFSRPALHPTAA
jgi:hypothetical protein